MRNKIVHGTASRRIEMPRLWRMHGANAWRECMAQWRCYMHEAVIMSGTSETFICSSNGSGVEQSESKRYT